MVCLVWERGMRGRRECVGVCMDACEWVGRGGWMDGWGDVAEGSVRWKNSKDKRVCVMCHNGDRSSAFGFLGKETAETETDKPTEGERERRREEGMIKRIAAITMRHLTGWTLSPSSLLSSMSMLLCQTWCSKQEMDALHSYTPVCPHTHIHTFLKSHQCFSAETQS